MRLATIMVALSTSFAAHGGYFRVQTDQSGGNTQLDLTHTQYFIINPADLVALGGSDFLLGGSFVMKEGTGTTASIEINLFKLLTGGAVPTPDGAALATAQFTRTEFCAQVTGNCQSYDVHVLDFLAPVSLSETVTYYMELRSLPPPGPQVEAYFIKRRADNSFVFVDGEEPVPEPSTIGLTALGLIAAFRFTRRK